MEIFQFFDQNYGNSNFLTFSQMYFYSLKSFLFYLEYRKSIFRGLFHSWKQKHKKWPSLHSRRRKWQGTGTEGKGRGGGDCPFHFFDFDGLGGGMTSQDWWQKFIFLIGKTGLVVLKDHLAIESKVKKKFKKLILFKRYEALKCHIFLKIITKIAEF